MNQFDDYFTIKVDLLLASSQPPHMASGCGSWLDYYSLQSDINQPITAACLVADTVWLGDARGQLFAFRFAHLSTTLNPPPSLSLSLSSCYFAMKEWLIQFCRPVHVHNLKISDSNLICCVWFLAHERTSAFSRTPWNRKRPVRPPCAV